MMIKEASNWMKRESI